MLPGSHRLHRAVGRFRRRFAPGALILMYHRVTELEADPWRMVVSPRHFAEHLQVIRSLGSPMALTTLVADLGRRTMRDRSIVITMDDGYLDNLTMARPLLAEADVPATAFITTSMVDGAWEFWWDELEQLLLLPDVLRDRLELSVDRVSRCWELGGASRYTPEQRRADAGLRPWSVESSPRMSFFYDVYLFLHRLSHETRRDALSSLAGWTGVQPVVRKTHLTMSSEQLRELADGSLVDIGAHTVTHPYLSYLRPEVQATEVSTSRWHLQELLERPVESFAYPHGDHAPGTVAEVRRTFRCACTTVGESVLPGCDPFLLPRVEVEDWDGETFARRLRSWFRG
jgi:peptidoglycan/xylan/chitin deacetylase (PgdA/CDA1 family)